MVCDRRADYNPIMLACHSMLLPLALLALLGRATDARAQESAPNIDPAQIRFITPSASSSLCVGKPTTPMCGIETLIGCASYIWNEACTAINSPVYDHVRRNVRIEYAIVKAGFVNKAKVRAAHAASIDKEYGDVPWLSEDAFQARFWDRECPVDRSTCEGFPWSESLFTVSPRGRISEFWGLSMAGIFVQEYWFVD